MIEMRLGKIIYWQTKPYFIFKPNAFQRHQAFMNGKRTKCEYLRIKRVEFEQRIQEHWEVIQNFDVVTESGIVAGDASLYWPEAMNTAPMNKAAVRVPSTSDATSLSTTIHATTNSVAIEESASFFESAAVRRSTVEESVPLVESTLGESDTTTSIDTDSLTKDFPENSGKDIHNARRASRTVESQKVESPKVKSQKVESQKAESLRDISQNFSEISVDSLHDNITQERTRVYFNEIDDTGSGDSAGEFPAKVRPRSLAEVEELFRSCEYPLAEAARYWDHYTANGWRVGRNPMKDWKAAAANWMRNYREMTFTASHIASRATQPGASPNERSSSDRSPSDREKRAGFSHSMEDFQRIAAANNLASSA